MMNLYTLYSILILILIIPVKGLAQNPKNNENDLIAIKEASKSFSAAYMRGDYQGMADAYTTGGKIFPNNADIIVGKEAIRKRWILPENQKVVYHKSTPIEIEIIDDTAIDHGYYEGETLFSNGKKSKWKGKYVIVWKKVGGKWKMYLDIWNRIKV